MKTEVNSEYVKDPDIPTELSLMQTSSPMKKFAKVIIKDDDFGDTLDKWEERLKNGELEEETFLTDVVEAKEKQTEEEEEEIE